MPWDYVLYEVDNDLYLSVLAGSVAMFEAIIKLNATERSTYEQEGQSYIAALAKTLLNKCATTYRERLLINLKFNVQDT